MRARYPDIEDVVVRDGVRIGYEVYGSGAPTILLPTSMPLVHARQWKAQVPFLARHFRMVVVDGRGNGRSDRPVGPAAYVLAEQVADLVAVLDATGTDQAVVARPPAPDQAHPGRDRLSPDAIHADFAGFADFFFSTVFTDPHSTKQLDDALEWAGGTSADVLVDFFAAESDRSRERGREISETGRCPVPVG